MENGRAIKNKVVIGRLDRVDLPEFGLFDIPVKIDTGARRSALHCSSLRSERRDGRDFLVFSLPFGSGGIERTSGAEPEREFWITNFFQKPVRSSNGQVENRFVIQTTVVLFGRRIKTTFSLTDRSDMRYPILLGRKLLRGKFIVDVSLKDCSFNHKVAHSKPITEQDQ